ncbi:MAG: diaminopimelate epimerase [Armatimonadetes bacterium]|nr:diaminopimelate epimerase [Armatimonadota bacterium]MCX7969340.1 diaminopimelate epimerase [Armatimonadota bacterium]MDW8142606.1 diaminopimelate epimerase [Armatimonadota bacterium]
MIFVKMHGIGNDFVVIGALDELPLPEDRLSDFALFVCDRHFGVGADGVIWVLPSQVADFKMRIFNPDGSEAEMCGNGIRCAAKWFYDRDYAKGSAIRVETLAGIKTVWVQGRGGKAIAVTVDMGEPIFEPSLIPTKLGEGSEAIEVPLDVEGFGTYLVSAVSMGNPHCVAFVNDVDNFPVEKVGPQIEHHPAFPKRTNVEFVQILSRSEMKVRVWERGAGLTLACGTGACASLAVSARIGKTDRKAAVHLPGGTLTIEWRDDGRIYMTGPAVEVFRGELVWENKNDSQ